MSKTKTHKLAVFGSRSLGGDAVRELIREVCDRHEITHIITGGDVHGVSAEARTYAQQADGIALTLHWLDRAHRAQGAFHHRGQTVVDEADIALLIHDGTSTGTANELAQVRKAKQPHIYRVFKPTGVAYIASPYWSPDRKTREFRRSQAVLYAEAMMRLGRLVYSPFMHSTPAMDADIDEEYWRDHGAAIAAKCEQLILLQFPGWESSTGVEREIEAWQAAHPDKPLTLIKQREIQGLIDLTVKQTSEATTPIDLTPASHNDLTPA